MKALFRADASDVLGGGQVMRCLAIADRLSAAGWECVFAANRQAENIIKRLNEYTLLKLPDEIVSQAGEAEFIGSQTGGDMDLAVIDHYKRDREFESGLRKFSERILVMDDIHDRRHDCDFLLDQTHGRMNHEYEKLVNNDCRLLLGTGFALLRPEFLYGRAKSLAGRKIRKSIDRIFISFGATDFYDITSRALNAVERLDKETEIDIVLSGNAPHLGTVKEKIKTMRQRVNLYVDCENVAEILSRADLAIGSPGITSWERCTLGVPALLVPWAENQKDNAAILDKCGAAWNLGWYGDVGEGVILEALEKFFDDIDKLNEMSAAAAAVCDGRGLIRVMMEILPPGYDKSGNAVSLRFATNRDCDKMFEWQQHDSTRHYFRTPEKPTWSEHEDWFSKCLADPDRLLMVIERAGESVGVLRLDIRDENVFEISIYVDPARYGKGIASAALKMAQSIFADEILLADVANDNKSSNALFKKSNFQINSDGIYQWRQSD